MKKFSDHLPLYRCVEILARGGIKISKQTLSKWVVQVGLELEPICLELEKKIKESQNVFIDETPIEMQDKGAGKTKKGFMWVLVGGKSGDPADRVYRFTTNRQHKHAFHILDNFRGRFHSDKYGAYEKLSHQEKMTWCPCMSHVRRKFVEAEAGDPEFRDKILNKMKTLFLLEKKSWELSEEERLQIRKEKEMPILDEMISLMEERLKQGDLLPKSKLRKAIEYTLRLKPFLKNYLDHPFARLDNNVAERAIRPLTIGRKNWLFFGSERGGKAAANIYSLVQTCRAHKVDPRQYLEDVLRRLMSHSNNKLYELLPCTWKKIE